MQESGPCRGRARALEGVAGSHRELETQQGCSPLTLSASLPHESWAHGFGKLHEIVPEWGLLSLGTWELMVPRVSPVGRLWPGALPHDCGALGKLFYFVVCLLCGGDWMMTAAS